MLTYRMFVLFCSLFFMVRSSSVLITVSTVPDKIEYSVICQDVETKNVVWNYTLKPELYVATTAHSDDYFFATIVTEPYGFNYLYVFSKTRGFMKQFELSSLGAGRPIWAADYPTSGPFKDRLLILCSGLFSEDDEQHYYVNYLFSVDVEHESIDLQMSLERDPSHPIPTPNGGSVGRFFEDDEKFIFWSSFYDPPPNLTFVDLSNSSIVNPSWKSRKIGQWKTDYPIFFAFQSFVKNSKDGTLIGLREIIDQQKEAAGTAFYRVSRSKDSEEIMNYEDVFYWIQQGLEYEGGGTAFCEEEGIVFIATVRSLIDTTTMINYFVSGETKESGIKDWETRKNCQVTMMECM